MSSWRDLTLTDWVQVGHFCFLVYRALEAIRELSNRLLDWRKMRPSEALLIRCSLRQLRSSEVFKSIRDRGETIDGWKTTGLREPYSIDYYPESRTKYRFIVPSWPKNEAEWSTAQNETSVLIGFEGPTPNRNFRKIFILRRQSMIAPGRFDDVIRFGYDSATQFKFARRLNVRTVALVFECRDIPANPFHVILVDLLEKTYKKLPPKHDPIMMIFADETMPNQISYLFRDAGVSYRFVDFELAESSDDGVHFSLNSIDFNITDTQGGWKFCTYNDGIRLPSNFFHLRSKENPNTVRGLRFDTREFTNEMSIDEWLAPFWSSPYGKRVKEAVDKFKSMIPSDVITRGHTPQFKLTRDAVLAWIPAVSSDLFQYRLHPFDGDLERFWSENPNSESKEMLKRALDGSDPEKLIVTVGVDEFDM